MNPPRAALRTYALLLITLLMSTGLPAEVEPRELHVIALQAAPAERLLPLIRPVVAEGVGLTGQGDQLIVRATPTEYAEILALVARLDRPPERLLIQLGIRRGMRSGRTGYALNGQVVQPGDADLHLRGSAKVYSTRELDDHEILQSVQALAGQVAQIGVGQRIPGAWLGPILSPQGVAYGAGIDAVEIRTGFYALARVIGEEVEVELAQQRETLSPDRNLMIDGSATQVTLRGPLGAWIDLGNHAEQDRHRTDGIARTRSTRDLRDTEESLRLRVDRLP